MFIFKKMKQERERRSRDRRRFEVARTIYPTIIKICQNNTYSLSSALKVPDSASYITVTCADALLRELDKNEGSQLREVEQQKGGKQ